MLGKASSSAFKAQGRAWHAVTAVAGQQSRCFANSAQRSARTVVSFYPSDSERLDEILNTVRDKIVLPSYLLPDQQQKIYRRHWAKNLESDPVIMEIDGEVLKFRYTNRMDLPNTRSLVKEAVQLMKTEDDFSNLPGLLEGIAHAKRTLPLSEYVRMTRKAAENDRLETILSCAKTADRTHFRLGWSPIANEVLFEIQARAINSDWAYKKTKKAADKTGWVIEQLATKSHKVRGIVDSPRTFSLANDPQVLAARLNMLAVMALKHYGGEDKDGLVASQAEELIRRWPEGAGLLDLYPTALFERKEEMNYLLDRRTYVRLTAPLLHGLIVASKVVPPTVAEPLKAIAKCVQTELEQALASEDLQIPDNRAIVIYNKLFNSPESLCTLN